MYCLEEEPLGRRGSHPVLLHNQGPASSANQVGELILGKAPQADLHDGRNHVANLSQQERIGRDCECHHRIARIERVLWCSGITDNIELRDVAVC